MQLEVDRSLGPTTLARVSGEIDVAVAADFRAGLTDLVDQGLHQIVVDLSGVDFIDSTGLGVLIYLRNQLREEYGGLAVVVTNPNIYKVFEVTGLLEVLAVCPSMESALDSGSWRAGALQSAGVQLGQDLGRPPRDLG